MTPTDNPPAWRGDEFTERHLNSWLEREFNWTDEREKAERKIRGFLALHPDVLERNWSWWQVLDHANAQF